MCDKCGELRNKIMHSSYMQEYIINDNPETEKRIIRRNVKANVKKGLINDDEVVDSGYLLDIAEYISYTAYEINKFFSDIEK